MSTTVLEALLNAQMNFDNVAKMGGGDNAIFRIAKEQLDSALKALENGLTLETIIQESLGDEVKTK